MTAKHRGPQVLRTLPATTPQEEHDLIELRRLEDRRAMLRDEPPDTFPRLDHRTLIARRQLRSTVESLRAQLGRGVKTKRIAFRGPDGREIETSESNAINFDRKAGFVRVGERAPERPDPTAWSGSHDEPTDVTEDDLHATIDEAVTLDENIAANKSARRRAWNRILKE